MPSESCYVTLMENAILLVATYGLLSSYFDDVTYYGFLFFAVYIGLCTCYASTVAGFCLMLLDDTTNTQLLLLDAERPFETTPPNNIAHAARVMARAATACSVALFVLFLTVGSEFLTEDSGPYSLSVIALKKDASEPVLVTQFAISTAFAVYGMITLMLIGSSQQLNGIFLRLQYMTQSVPLPPEQAASHATTADDFALFVRALLGLYVVICGSTGTFQDIFFLDYLPHLKTAIGGATNASTVPHLADPKTVIGGERRNYVALVFICMCLVTDALRALLPSRTSCIIVLTVTDLVQCFVNGVLAEVLFGDSSLTNFACAVLLICDGTCVMQASVMRIHDKVWTSVGAILHSATATEADKNRHAAAVSALPPDAMPPSQTQKPLTAHLQTLSTSMPGGVGLCFSESHFNVDNIKMRVFEKKSN